MDWRLISGKVIANEQGKIQMNNGKKMRKLQQQERQLKCAGIEN